MQKSRRCDILIIAVGSITHFLMAQLVGASWPLWSVLLAQGGLFLFSKRDDLPRVQLLIVLVAR